MLKIILTGPESSGKTTLAKALAQRFNAPLVEEFVREYFEKKQTHQYNQADLTDIAIGQLKSETRKTKSEIRLIVCDTDILTIKIWSEVVYGNCSLKLTQLIDNQLKTQNPKLQTIYLLCSPEDIKWEYDPLRENPNDRDHLFEIYEKELMKLEKNYFILRGSFEERLEKSILLVMRITGSKPYLDTTENN